jgi:hypothetical protein
MNTTYINKFVVLSFIMLNAACSTGPTIDSATSDMVVISAPSEQFVEAYDMAKKECLKYTKTAHYITDQTADLGIVSFNCIGEEIEEEVVAEESASEEEAVVEETVAEEEAMAEEAVSEEEAMVEETVAEEEAMIEETVVEEEAMAEEAVSEEAPEMEIEETSPE